MYKSLLLLVTLSFTVLSDVDPYEYIARILVTFKDNTSKYYWTSIPYSDEILKILYCANTDSTNILYPSRMQLGDSIKVSPEYYYAPDKARFLMEGYLKINSINKMVIARSDSTPLYSIWANPWQSVKAATLLLHTKPIYSNKLELIDDAGYGAVHLYVYDKTINIKSIEKLLAGCFFEFTECDKTKKQIESNAIVVIHDVSP